MRRIFRAAAWTLTALVVLLLLIHAQVLAALGGFLVKAGPPQKADIIVVLAGDSWGNRIRKAGDLVREGWAPKVLVSGPNGSYGSYECDLAIPFAVKAGYPESYFVHMEHTGRSTEEEAKAVVERLRTMGVKRMILVTSSFHTRRAGKIFHRAAPDLEIFVVASRDEFFSPENWWQSREARKTFLLEWMKTVAEW